MGENCVVVRDLTGAVCGDGACREDVQGAMSSPDEDSESKGF